MGGVGGSAAPQRLSEHPLCSYATLAANQRHGLPNISVRRHLTLHLSKHSQASTPWGQGWLWRLGAGMLIWDHHPSRALSAA